ncbi:hypothetical protein HanPSC8_Chr00c532g0808971 [Helianthus annuus]|nr:hypothetical protein HanPSC8_Chr00c532g0808971 [Helianthus annuus]
MLYSVRGVEVHFGTIRYGVPLSKIYPRQDLLLMLLNCVASKILEEQALQNFRRTSTGVHLLI